MSQNQTTINIKSLFHFFFLDKMFPETTTDLRAKLTIQRK